MKSTIIKFLSVILIFSISSCKKDGTSSFKDFQFADQKQVINCSDADSKLLNEALYSFEKDITTHFDKQQQNTIRAYNSFTRQATNRKVPLDQFVSKHSVAIAEALKNAGVIGAGTVNYTSNTISCIAENMQNDGLKTTFNALLSTNSMRKELYKEPLKTASGKVSKDKYLGLYVALEYFYAELLKIDFTKVDFNRPEPAKQQQQKPVTPAIPDNTKVDFNKRPAKQ